MDRQAPVATPCREHECQERAAVWNEHQVVVYFVLQHRMLPACRENARRRPEAQIIHVIGNVGPCNDTGRDDDDVADLHFFLTLPYATPPQVGPFRSGEGLWRPLTM